MLAERSPTKMKPLESVAFFETQTGVCTTKPEAIGQGHSDRRLLCSVCHIVAIKARTRSDEI